MTIMKQQAPLRESQALIGKPSALAARAAADGYVFMRGVLDLGLIQSLRNEIAAILVDLGWVDAAEPLALLRDSACMRTYRESSDPEWTEFYARVQRLRSFHAFAHQPQLAHIADAICGGQHLVHPRHICRLCFPQSQQFTTPAHQDYFYIGGTEDTWTAWMPLGDCPKSLGSLAVVPGSHKQGLLPVHVADGAGGHACDVAADAWHASDFKAGDLLILHSLLIHQGQDNLSERQLRLSLDVRFQHPGQAIHSSSLEPHMHVLTWDEIYQHWPAHDALKYYWKTIPLTIQD